MKKIITLPLMMLLMVSTAFALSMTRELPSEAAVGTTFDMNLIVTGASGNYGVLYVIDITGGCTIAGETHIPSGFLGLTDKTSTNEVLASSSAGTCTFTGDYQFADASGTLPLTVFPTQTVTIVGEDCAPSVTCSSAGYECGSVSDGCGTVLSCGSCSSGETCSTGTCIDITDPCSECTAWTDVACVGTVMKQVRNCPSDCSDDEEQFVASTTCEGEGTITPSGCEIWEETSETGCELAGWVVLVGIFIGIMIVIKMIP